MNFFKIRTSRLLLSATAVAGLSIAGLYGAANAVDTDAVAASQSADSASKTSDSSAPRDAIKKGSWGGAPWEFDPSTGILTVTGSANPGTLYELNYDKPWSRLQGGEQVGSELIKKIVLERPEGLRFIASSVGTFKPLPNLEEIEGIGQVNSSKAHTMSTMFEGATSLKSLDASGWDTSNVTSMWRTFRNDAALVTLDAANWDTSSVTNMEQVFSGAKSLKSLDVSNWDTSSVTNMHGTFVNAAALSDLDVSNWDTSNVTDMSDMFRGAASLSSLDVSKWKTSKVWGMKSMFEGATALSALDISGWDTSNVKDMESMFEGATALSSLDISGWDTSKVTAGKMADMLVGVTSLESLTLGDKSRLQANVGLPDPADKEGFTGKWVRLSPEMSDEAWWSGNSDALIDRSQGADAAGQYVWQEAAPVKFDLDGGKWGDDSEPTSVSGMKYLGVGDMATMPTETPVREGYIFEGWTQKDPAADHFMNVDARFLLTEPGEITITAKWVKEVVPQLPKLIPAQSCGTEATVWVPEMQGVDYATQKDGATVTVTASAQEGYAIAAGAATEWSFDVSAQECPVEPETDDLVVVSFDLNGGSGDFRSLVAPRGESVRLYDHAPVRDGYKFAGWLPVSLTKTAEPQSEGLMQPGTEQNIEGRTVLRAQWQADSTEPPVGPTEPTEPPVEPTEPPVGPTEPGDNAGETELPLTSPSPEQKKPATSLAVTGADILPLAAGVLLLLGAGITVTMAGRRRSRH